MLACSREALAEVVREYLLSSGEDRAVAFEKVITAIGPDLTAINAKELVGWLSDYFSPNQELGTANDDEIEAEIGTLMRGALEQSARRDRLIDQAYDGGAYDNVHDYEND